MIDIEEQSAREEAVQFALHGHRLRVSMGNTNILDDVSIEVPSSAICAVIGGSGAGKSTMLRILAGLQRPDSGDVRICGIDMRTNPFAARRHVGYMPETFGEFDNITVSEYLNYFAALYGINRTLRHALRDDLIDLADLTAKSHEAVGTLSRGMKQRLSLVRCLIHEPSVLLLDEPVSALSAADRDDVWAMLQELADLGKSIVFSAHDESDVASVCSNWITLCNGIAKATPPSHFDFLARAVVCSL